MSEWDAADLPILPRKAGEWPSARSWTDSERLELRDQQLQQAIRERDEALDLLAEAWEWTTPSVYGKLGYVDLRNRVRAALAAKEELGSE